MFGNNASLYIPLAAMLGSAVPSAQADTHPPQYVYHIRPQMMQGDTLHPLNELRDISPELYAAAVKKYEGREEVLNVNVDASNARWNDHVFLSPIDPSLIFKEQKRIGCSVERLESLSFFKIPIERISQHQVLLFEYRKALESPNDPVVMNSETRRIVVQDYVSPSTIPEEAVQHWTRLCNDGENPLFFSGIPHILVRGEINVEGCEVLPIISQNAAAKLNPS